MIKNLPVLTLTVVFFLFSQMLKAQESKDDISKYSRNNFNSWTITLGGGNMFMGGDLTSIGADDYSIDFGGHLSITKMFNASIGIEAMGLYSRTIAYPDKFKRNITELNGTSITPFMSGNLSLVLNLTNLVYTGNNYQRKWNFNIYTGFGMTLHKAYFYHRIDPELDQDWANNGEKTDSYTRIFSVPVAVALRYRLSKHFDLELRETMTYYTDDNLDGRVYGNAYDWTYYTSLGLVWKLGRKDRALEWTDPLDENFGRLDVVEEKVDRMSADSDNDGVSDYFDVDNETPEGVAVTGNGVAIDSDKDGHPDYKDIEPFTPIGVETDQFGKEIDSDGDGVGDSRDVEPNTKRGAFVNWQGRTIKGSGLADALIPAVYFKHNSSSIDYQLHRDLAVVAKILAYDPEVELEVIGYADYTGSDAYNQQIGLRRAEKVKQHLIQVYGVDESRLETKSFGSKKPLAVDKNFRAINRRVDFRVKN